MEVDKELSWKRCITLPTRAPEGARYLLDNPSTRILFIFSRNRLRAIGSEMAILYPGVSITMELYNIGIGLVFVPP
jgi:hypothetical protein